jgi:SAM-dependent methyltransferase
MGEIFSRPTPAQPMPFTGERLTSALTGQTEIEHLHRYVLARHLCRGRDVLDVASGEGYGAALLAQAAASVVGVEVAEDAVVHAAAAYQAANLRFLQGDARSLPLPDAAVNTVVSFETIEHFAEHERFLTEIRRVLRPGGLLVLSTPDRDNYSPADQPANPFHVLEMTREEFAGLLGRHFAQVTLLTQRSLVGSAMVVSAGVPAPELLCIERRGLGHLEASIGLARPQYLVAVASDADLPPIPASSLFIESGNIAGWVEGLRRTAVAEAEDRAAAAEATAVTERQARERVEATAVAERQARETAEATAVRVEAELTEQQERVAALRASTSWRITAPIRLAAKLLQQRR